MSSLPGAKISLTHPDASNPKVTVNGGSNGEKDYSFLFKDARYNGKGGAYNRSSYRKKRDDNRKPKRNDNHGGAPDDNDPDDDDNNGDSGDDDTRSSDSHSLSGSSNT